jgi:hypothetical protein
MHHVTEWDAGTISQIAVACGTALLAIATFWLAKGAAEQAKATRRMVEIAERQLQATTEPHLSVDPVYPGNSEDFRAVINVRNLGSMDAKITKAGLQFPNLRAAYDAKSDVIQSGADCALYFSAGSPARAGTAVATVEYEGPGSGVRARLVAQLSFDGESFSFVKEQVDRL